MRITTRQFCDAFGVNPHTVRAAARKLHITGDKNDRLLLTPQQVFDLVCQIRINPHNISKKETRKIIRSALFDYCNHER